MQPLLFSGSSHPGLAQEVSVLSGIPLGKMELRLFPDQEIDVEIKERVARREVFVLQSVALNPNFYLMELLIILDALKRGGAGRVTVVLPYYGYARQDRIDRPGVPITAKLVADLLTTAGAGRIIALDLHSEQIEGFFNIPVEQVLSRSLLIPHCAASLDLTHAVVVAPDKGGIKIAGDYSKRLGIPIAFIDKGRIDPYHVELQYFVGDVKGRLVILPDDMCSTGGTLINAAKACVEAGAKEIISVVGHGLFIGKALENLKRSPIEKMIVTNSVPLSEAAKANPAIQVISVAPVLAEAMKRAAFLECA